LNNFALKPNPSQVIVNLAALHKDEAFLRSLERHKNQVVGVYEGIGRYGAAQSEVVLEVAALTEADVYSLGGWSSSFDDLVRMAAWQIYGRAPSETAIAELHMRVQALESEAGAWWLKPESTKRPCANAAACRDAAIGKANSGCVAQEARHLNDANSAT
jgi:hypothetical protein